MRPADTWKDYELLDATDGNRLERWGETLLVRPDPQDVYKRQGTQAALVQGCGNLLSRFAVGIPAEDLLHNRSRFRVDMV